MKVRASGFLSLVPQIRTATAWLCFLFFIFSFLASSWFIGYNLISWVVVYFSFSSPVSCIQSCFSCVLIPIGFSCIQLPSCVQSPRLPQCEYSSPDFYFLLILLCHSPHVTCQISMSITVLQYDIEATIPDSFFAFSPILSFVIRCLTSSRDAILFPACIWSCNSTKCPRRWGRSWQFIL